MLNVYIYMKKHKESSNGGQMDIIQVKVYTSKWIQESFQCPLKKKPSMRELGVDETFSTPHPRTPHTPIHDEL